MKVPESGSIDDGQEETDNELSPVGAADGNKWLGNASKQDRAHKSTRNSTRESEVIVCRCEGVGHIPKRRPICEDIVNSLYIERLFHLGVRRNAQVKHENYRYECTKEKI